MKVRPCEMCDNTLKKKELTWNEMLEEGEGIYKRADADTSRFIVLSCTTTPRKKVVLWYLNNKIEPADPEWADSASYGYKFIKTDEKLYLSIK